MPCLIFGALADPTRRAILARLNEGEAPVSQLAQPFSISLPAMSRHLKVLEAAYMEKYRRHWDESLNRLERHLGELQRKAKP
ncbi:ArsR/SmtB family transcription factor [Arthrobacter wenxiniae]|uniref:Helix-turn-helix transcriptional regulator n=1 Tax=Arthrobacter wenxiniae TaxID=2713570 RepID=A0A7Y7M145_9MICC|nr:metalloregulator ArsR/SmtB family transcription factor [Arthrobacter wenxiniae]NVM96356.1 helix-turn-helix transcriptional regulator [Arthrobacter wenxiniae]